MNTITKEYYVRQTDRKTFITKDILRYDLKTHTYYTVDWLSQNLEDYMMGNIPDQKQVEFKQFIAVIIKLNIIF
jgi:pilus assembly protein CpaF